MKRHSPASLSLSPANSPLATLAPSYEALKGLYGVMVVIAVDEAPERLKEAGVTKARLVPMVEQELQRNGIRVMDAEKMYAGAPVCILAFTSAFIENAFMLHTDVIDGPALSVFRSVRIDLPILWTDSTISSRPNPENVQRVLLEMTGRFATDYRKANPKK